VNSPVPFLSPSEAARQLGVSPKALRLYEQRVLVAPARTGAGRRAYGPGEMARAAEVVALRALGLSLAQIARVLAGDPAGLEAALATHQTALEGQLRQLAGTVEKVRNLRAGLAQGQAPAAGELVRLLEPDTELRAAFDLPWPWGGERFELPGVRPLTYIIGPLGSGKTRLAQRLVPLHSGFDRLRLGEAWDHWSDPKYDLLELSLLKSRPEHRSAYQRSLPGLAASGANRSKPLCRGTSRYPARRVLLGPGQACGWSRVGRRPSRRTRL